MGFRDDRVFTLSKYVERIILAFHFIYKIYATHTCTHNNIMCVHKGRHITITSNAHVHTSSCCRCTVDLKISLIIVNIPWKELPKAKRLEVSFKLGNCGEVAGGGGLEETA